MATLALMAAPSLAAAQLPGQGFLPGDRAWELVSPPDKNGADVLVDAGRIRAASSDRDLPMALMFPSLGAFGEVEGAHNATDYVSERTLEPGTSGWSSRNVFPSQESLSVLQFVFGTEALYLRASNDLRTGIFRALSPLPGTPEAVAKALNIYRRSNLRPAGGGAFELLTGCTFDCAIATPTPFGENARAVAATDDLGHVLLTSPNALTEDSPPSGVKLYQSGALGPRLVGYVPPGSDSECTGVAPNCVVIANAKPGSASTTTAAPSFVPRVLSQDGGRAFFTGSSSGPVNAYLRDDRGTELADDDITVKLNASERSAPGTPAAVTYWGASEAGDRAFFVTTEALTDDAPSEGAKLYRWSQLADGDGHHLAYLSADLEPGDALGDVLGVLGASDNGTVAYFLQRGQIVAGQPQLGSAVGIYAWRQGLGVQYVGWVTDPVDVGDDLPGAGNSYNVAPFQLGSRVTPDGRRLLISLRQPPHPGGFDHGSCPNDRGTAIEGRKGCRELYLYDLAGASLVCVSCAADETPPVTPAAYSLRSLRSSTNTAEYLTRALSDDGRYVFFTSGERLAPDDINGRLDAYVFDAADGSVRLLSSGESRADSFFVDASADGRDAFIVTREQLSGWDVDENRDVYDARVGGGVAEPAEAKAPCAADACQPAPSIAAPLLPASQKRRANKPRKGRRACRGRSKARKRCATIRRRHHRRRARGRR